MASALGPGRKRRRKRSGGRGIAAQIDKVLFYYEGPQILTLIDDRKHLWIGVAIERHDDMGYPVFCAQISQGDFDRYMRCHVDLRYLLQFRARADPRIADISNMSSTIIHLFQVTPRPEWFPEDGFFASSHPPDPPT